MTTFDLAEVCDFVAGLSEEMDRCDNGEGMECSTVDAALRHYADLCCRFRDEVRQWGRAVFAGQVAHDPEVERAWRAEGYQLYNRAIGMWQHGQKSEGPCYVLEGHIVLQAALWDLYRLLNPWVTPKLAVGPSARRGFTLNSASTDEVHRLVALLPPLPAKWQPDDPLQQALYRKLQTS
jgi:hypothetical protein